MMNRREPSTAPVADEQLVQRALTAARAHFGADWAPSRVASAPGRVELLGNHLDYNGGHVLCAAIDRSIVVLLAESPEQDDDIRALAADRLALGVQSLTRDDLTDWRNAEPPPAPFDYLRGAVAALTGSSAARLLAAPISLSFTGDIPEGSGLSSSAALCVSLVLALAEARPANRDLVLLAQEAEHRAGTPCGTMDQSASVAGGVIRFDPVTLNVERLNPDLGDLAFVVLDSGVQRSLGSSSYPKRVEESREALALAGAALGRSVPNLASLTGAELVDLERRNALPPTLLRRARHIVTETARVAAGFRALEARDWATFGGLMTASGRSSAVDYEISHPRVEALVTTALSVSGVLGARMMGGGEGGSVLALAPRSSLAELESTLRAGYYREHGMERQTDLLHVCSFAPGASVGSADGQSG